MGFVLMGPAAKYTCQCMFQFVSMCYYEDILSSLPFVLLWWKQPKTTSHCEELVPENVYILHLDMVNASSEQ